MSIFKRKDYAYQTLFDNYNDDRPFGAYYSARNDGSYSVFGYFYRNNKIYVSKFEYAKDSSLRTEIIEYIEVLTKHPDGKISTEMLESGSKYDSYLARFKKMFEAYMIAQKNYKEIWAKRAKEAYRINRDKIRPYKTKTKTSYDAYHIFDSKKIYHKESLEIRDVAHFYDEENKILYRYERAENQPLSRPQVEIVKKSADGKPTIYGVVDIEQFQPVFEKLIKIDQTAKQCYNDIWLGEVLSQEIFNRFDIDFSQEM